MSEPLHQPFKEIPLTQGKVALVDAEDFDFLNQWKWYALKNGRTFYAVRNKTVGKKKQTMVIMHRIILNAEVSQQVDHVNNDGLDNRKVNIRVATKSENHRNKTPHKNSTSKYLGVDYNSTSKGRKKWRAQIRDKNSKPVYIGRFLTEKEAALAYNEAAKKHHGDFANLNEIA